MEDKKIKVRQSVIDEFRKIGMSASLKKYRAGEGSEEFNEGIRRYYPKASKDGPAADAKAGAQKIADDARTIAEKAKTDGKAVGETAKTAATNLASSIKGGTTTGTTTPSATAKGSSSSAQKVAQRRLSVREATKVTDARLATLRAAKDDKGASFKAQMAAAKEMDRIKKKRKELAARRAAKLEKASSKGSGSY